MTMSLEQIETILATHQHNGSDGTVPLRNQDWQQLGRTVLAGANTSISINIPPKRHLKVLITFGAKSGGSDDYLTFNGDTGANYTFINSGGAARVSQTQIDIRDGLGSALGAYCVIDITNNLSTLVKSVVIHTVNRIVSAGTAQTFYQIFGTWVNISAFITTITLTSSDLDTYPAGSEIIVMGSKE